MVDFSAKIEECVEQAHDGYLLADTTYKQYRSHLRRFWRWLSARGFDALTPEIVTEYLDYLQRPRPAGGRGYAPRSTRFSWVSLSFWDRWMLEEGHWPVTIMPPYKLPKIPDSDQPVCSRQDAEALAAATALIEDPFRRALATAVYFVFATATIRHSELRALKTGNFDRREKSLRVIRGKGNKNRKLFLTDNCVTAIENWMAVRPKDTKHDFLFCWDRTRGLGEKGVYALLEEISSAAGFEGVVKAHKPHAMRHGSASRALEDGESIDQVRARLGHTSVRTTQIYLHSDEASLASTRNVTELPLPGTDPMECGASKAASNGHAKNGRNGNTNDPRSHRRRLRGKLRRQQPER